MSNLEPLLTTAEPAYPQSLKKFNQGGNSPAANYMFKVSNRNTRTRCEICSDFSTWIKVFHYIKVLGCG